MESIQQGETINKHGICKLDFMVNLLPVLEGKNTKLDYAKFKSWLSYIIKRELTDQEELDFMQGIVNYVNTEPGTDRRMTALNYLVETEFLKMKV